MKSTVKRIAAIVLAAMLALASMGSALAAEYYSGSFSVSSRVIRPTAEPIDEATEEPVVEATEEPIVETTPEPAPEPEIDISKLKVEIFTDRSDVMTIGDIITLTSVLTGFEGLTYTLQWQYDDGSGWQDAPDATEATYSFAVDEINACYNWRLAVSL